MAKANAKIATKTKSQTYSTKWLRNALRSVGISSQEAIKEIAPNLYDVTSSGVTTSRTLINTLRRNSNNTNRISDTLKSNKYVQYAQTAYKNAMSDIKTGNFNNQERQEQALESSMMGDMGDLTEGFTFGDDGAEESSNVNVNYINTGAGNDAMLHLSNQIQTQSKAQVQMQKASMDAYIAVNSASMQQISQIGSEIVGHLSNVNNHLSALVQYQNENMTKFIEASLVYYENAGSAINNGKTDSSSKDKISAYDVFNSSSGGINMKQYKMYVKKQAKDMLEHSDIGLLKSLADDPMMMDMIVSNPIGFLSQGLVGHMVPTVLKTSMEAMDKTFENFLPTMLSKLSDLADTEGNDMISKFKRSIGKTFGLRNERTTNFNKVEIERGATPFDGETKHAITEIITKELRDQTGYLEIIANQYTNGDAKSLVRKHGEYWSYNKNAYINRDDIDIEIADKIVDSIRSAFNDTRFGKDLKENLIDTRTTEAARTEMAFTIDELFVELEKQKGYVSLEDILTIIDNGGANKKTKETIKKYIRKMSRTNRTAFDSVNTGRLRSQGSAEETRNSIMEDYTGNNLLNSSFNGDEDVDEILQRIKGYGSYSDRRARKVRGINRSVRRENVPDDSNDTPHNSRIIEKMRQASNGAVSMMQTIMSGDTEGTIQQGAEFISNGLKSLGTKLQEYAEKEGGILNQVKENFTNIGTEVKDGIMLKFFGKKKDDSGKYVRDDDENGGIFGAIGNTFTSGFNGWIDAFFGTDENDPDAARDEHKKSIIDTIKGNLPNAITGSLIGAGMGMLSGGSILSMMIGGPFGGAILGATTGFLAKNEKFQTWLFGKDNEDGSHTEGLISKNVQDYFKKNKTKLIGGAALGAVTGGITGGGILGMLIGGPLAGSIMGMASSVLLSSGSFKKFLLGDEEKGQKGLFKAISDAFRTGMKKSGASNVEGADGAKTIGMGLFGAGTGALSSAILSKMGILGASLTPMGPIGGAIAGLALSIKAQSGNFKQWLFGEKDGLELGDGRKIKKQGVLGQMGNMIMANVITPMKHEVEYIAKDFMSTAKAKVLAPFAAVAEYTSGKFGEMFGKLSESINGAVSGVVSFAKETVSSLFAPITSAIGGLMKTATDATWKLIKHTMSTPGKIAIAVIKGLNLKEKFNDLKPVKFFKGLAKDIRNLVLTGIKTTFKMIGAVAAAPFKALGWGIGKIVKGAGNLAGKIGDKVKDKLSKNKTFNKIKDKYDEIKLGSGKVTDNLFQRYNRRQKDYKAEQAEIKAMKEKNKIHDKNAKLLAKASKGQFSQDTEEARTWLKYNNPALYKKLEGMSITEETELDKHGKGTKGMDLSRAKLNDLSEEGKQTKLLFDIRNIIDNIIHKMQGDDQTYENDEERDTREARERTAKSQQKSHRERRSKWLSYEGFMVYVGEKSEKYNPGDIRNGNFTKITDPDSIPEKVQEFANQVANEGIPEAPKPQTIKEKVMAGVNNVKKYFKNDFFSNTRGNYDKYVRNADKTWTEEFLSKHTNGEFTSDSREARAWLQENNPKAYAKFISRITGENVEGYAAGGIIKKGLSIVGEKGAELLYKAKNGLTSILDADSTEDVIEDASRGKKKKNKLTKWMNKVSGEKPSESDSSLENYSDEERADAKLAAYFKAKKANGRAGGQLDALAEASLATLSEHADMRRDSLSAALGKAKTHDQLKKEKEEEKAREEQKKYQDAMLATTKENTESTKSYHAAWDKLWNPKSGLIMIAGIAVYSWLKKNFPGLIDGFKNLLGKLGTFASSSIGTLISDVIDANTKGTRTDGNTMVEEATKIVNDIKNGDIITDSKGNAKQSTEPILKVLARTALNYKNSAFKTKGSKLPGLIGKNSRIANAEKSVFNTFKKGKTTLGNIGESFSKYLTNTKDLADLAFTEGDEFLEAGTKMEQLGAKVINSKTADRIRYGKAAVKNYASQIGSRIANSKVGKAATGLVDNVSKAGSKVANITDDVVTKGKNAITNGVKNAGVKITQKASKDDGFLSTVCKYIDKFFEFIKKKFAAKAGTSLGDDALKGVSKTGLIKALKSQWDNVCTKLAAKISAITGKGVGAAAVSFGLSEVIFASIGALNGISGTAKLFQVDSDKVDGTMKLIASIFGALTGTTLGGIIDVILSVIGQIMGTDILHCIAVGMYNVIVGKDSEKSKDLEKNMSGFKDAYFEERDKTLEKQYNTQKKAGIIGEDVTYDMFVQGVQDGTYEASYTSFQDWNVQKNKSWGDKIATGAGKLWKGTKNAAKSAGKFLFGGKYVSYQDSNGNTYIENNDGSWQVKDADGNDLGSVSKKAIPKDAQKIEVKSDNILKRVGKGVASGAKKIGSGVSKVFNVAKDGIKKGWAKASLSVSGFIENFGKNAEDLNERLKTIDSNVKKSIKNFFSSHTEQRWHAADGGYYQSNGKTFDYFNEAGDKMAEGISQEEFSELCKTGVVVADKAETVTVSSGLKTKFKDLNVALSNTFNTGITKAKEVFSKVTSTVSNVFGEIKTKGVAGFIGGIFKKEKSMVWYDTQGNYYKLESNNTYGYYNINGDLLQEKVTTQKVEELQRAGLLTKGEIISDSPAKKAINDIKNTVKETWQTAKDTVKSGWQTAKDTVKSGWNKFTSLFTGGSGGGYGSTFDTSINMPKGGYGGGRGPETVNGIPYYSQNDSRWADTPYTAGMDNATMGNTGCGPTAMAMVASGMGKNVSPMDMANIAKMTGNRDNTGTNWNFVGQASNMMGLPSQQTLNPSEKDIDAQLSTGNPVLLSGVGSGNGTDPYTSAGHYVVATGKDKNGNVLINDPRGKQYSKAYNMKNIANKTGSSWSFGGFGKKILNTVIKGGRGPSSIKASDVINIARNEIGYLEKNSDDGLYDKKANAGTGNYNKYGKELGSPFGHARNLAWCATFAVWCFWKASGENKDLTSQVLHGATTASCKTNEDCFRRAGKWLEPGSVPKAGYVIFYTHSHTGIVTGSDGQNVSTIEGNTSGDSSYERNGGTVYTKTRSINDSKIKGYGIPDLDIDVNIVGDLTSGISDSYVDTSSSNSTTNESKFSKLTSFLGGFISEFGNRALSGDFSNTNYTSLYRDNGTSTTSTGSGATTSYTPISTTGDYANDIWNYLTKTEGLNAKAAAGVMGCWEQESANKPNRLEGDYLKTYPGFDAAMNDLNGYTTNVLFPAYERSGMSIKKDAYKGPDGNYYPGIGLAQWTGPRAYNLRKFGEENGGDWRKLETQLNYFSSYPGEFNSRTGLKEEMNNAGSVQEATQIFGTKFEGHSVDQKRINHATSYYNKFASQGGGAGEGTHLSNRYKSRLAKAKKISRGGYGYVDYSSTQNLQSQTSTKQLNVAGNVQKYIKVTSSNSTNDLIMNAIEILAAIAGNTSDASVKLNSLSYLQNLTSGGNSTNVIVGSDGKPKVSNISSKETPADIRRRQTASKIARGGY